MGNLRYRVWFRSLSLSLMGKGASFSYVIPVVDPDCYADSSLSDSHFLKAVFMSLISPYNNKNLPMYICRSKQNPCIRTFVRNQFLGLVNFWDWNEQGTFSSRSTLTTKKPAYTWSWNLETVDRLRRASTHFISLDVGSLASSPLFGVYKVHGWGPIAQLLKNL
jgi:hypothetical protein